MYAEFASDAKVQSMDETLQRRFIMFLCLNCSGEFERLSDDELAFALRISVDELVKTREVFKQKRFLDADGKIRSWNKRQYKSDSSTERVQKHRERQRNGHETLQERPQIQITDTDTDSERTKITTAAPSVPAEFGELKQIFPKRAGDQPWPAALRCCHARLREGHTWPEILDGARRYAAFCAATGKVRTETVMQAKRFCGPDKPFLNDWALPATKAEVRQDKSISASLQWLADQEAKDASH